MKLARRAARDQGFTVSDEQNASFSASRGSMALSFLAGGLISHNNFTVKVEQGHGDSEIIIDGKSWMSTGLVGQGRESKAIKAFGDAVMAVIQEEGGKVLASNEF
jgi:hypothetical protein